MTDAQSKSPTRGRALLWQGILVCILGPVILAVQMANRSLTSPLYVPILATLGVALMGWSLVQRRTLWRWFAAGLAVPFAALTWLMFAGMSTPAYTGPATVGSVFPSFETRLASGEGFRAGDLKGDKNTVLLFYRGHW